MVLNGLFLISFQFLYNFDLFTLVLELNKFVFISVVNFFKNFDDWFCSKTCLNLAISRIKLLQNKRDLQLKHMRKEIAQFLQAGQEAIARIRVGIPPSRF